MASVIDTVRTVFMSKYSIFKLVTISLVLSLPLYEIWIKFDGWTSTSGLITIFAAIFFLGYIVYGAHNLTNEKYILLPSFINPFKILLAGIGSIVSMGPVIALMTYVGYCLSIIFSNKGFTPAASITSISMIELIIFGLLSTQMCLFAHNFNPLEAYNPIKIFKIFPDFAIKAYSMTVGLAIFSCVLLLPIGFLAKLMFGTEKVFFCVMVLFATILLTLSFLYYAQCYSETVILVKSEEEMTSVRDQDLLNNEIEI